MGGQVQAPDLFRAAYTARADKIAKGEVRAGGKISFTMRLTPKVFGHIRNEAIRRGTTVASVARELIYAGLDEEGWEA